ncbi:hypothetical protein, partial [Acinetobacter pittii]|uniref:hypothetical protein n=1 Tax=Acinetobacter pittii TaxID=48296 RepID=UPI001A9158EC
RQATSTMAYTKVLFFFFFAAVAMVASAAEEELVREKKQVYYGVAGYRDNGQWAPGKYEGPTYARAAYAPVPAVVPAAVHAPVHAAYPYAAVPAYAGVVY